MPTTIAYIDGANLDKGVKSDLKDMKNKLSYEKTPTRD
jgi:hypothetical protein